MNEVIEFAKRFNKLNADLFSDHAFELICECSLGSLYQWFKDCKTEQDVNAVVEAIWPECEEEDEE